MAMNPSTLLGAGPLASLRSWFARGLIKAAGLPIVAPWVTASFILPTFRLLVKEGYEKNAAVYACISALAFSFSEPPVVITDDEGNTVVNHPLKKLIQRPNVLMGEAELMASTIVYMAIGGNAFWYKVRSNAGRVVELWPYHAGQMSPVPGGDSWIDHYAYDAGFTGKTIPVKRDDIVHFKWPTPDPYQPWQAMPPLKGVARDVDSANEITRYLFALLKNDAVPRTALVLPAGVTLPDTQYNRLKAEWQQKHGDENRGGMGIIEGGADIKRIGLDLKELAFQALYDVPERHIAAALRVPMSVAGIGAEPIYANAAEGRAAFTEQGLAPLWTLAAGEIQNSLADTEFGGAITVGHDLSKITALSEKVDKRRDWALRAFGAGGIMRNEFRAAAGLPPVVGGNVFLTNLSIVTEEAEIESQPGGKGAGTRGDSRIAPTTKASRRQASQRVGQSLQRIRREVAKKMEKAVDSYFADLADRVVERAKKSWNGRVQAKVLPDPEDLLKPSDGSELKAVVKRFYVEILSASWETWNLALGVEAAFDLQDPAVSAVLKMAGMNIGDINDTTLDAVRQLLIYGNEQGWSVDRLVRGDDEQPGLRAIIEETYKDRARTIARTELGTAQNTATSLRYKNAGVKHVLVLDDGADDDDEACKQLNGSTQTIEWSEKNALQHPNCTRAFAPVFD